jgi:hypothetical protein
MFSIALLNIRDPFQGRVKGDLQRICETGLVVQGLLRDHQKSQFYWQLCSPFVRRGTRVACETERQLVGLRWSHGFSRCLLIIEPKLYETPLATTNPPPTAAALQGFRSHRLKKDAAVINAEFLHRLFPRADEIPLEHRPPAAIHQRRLLINGELRIWEGFCQTVLSPVRFRNTAGVLEHVELGSYPEGSESDADDALAAALLAYDDGRGAWPTMSVAERIGDLTGG